MKKIQLLQAIVLITAIGCLLQSCSPGDEKSAEKGKIGQMTDEAGSKISKSIQTPIDQAQKASELANQQANELDKQLQKNE